ncbi:MAG: phosphoribosyltransferase family protein [Gammaproteobacteria bacterium]
MQKTYITADELLLDAFRLAAAIHNSGFRPDLLVGVWRGGTPVAIAVQEYFEYLGAPLDHSVIRCSSYTGIGRQDSRVRIEGIEYIVEHTGTDSYVLIVDDVFDSGLSIHAIFEELKRRAGDALPGDIRTAMPWYKPGNNKTGRVPDYYLHTTDHWLVFPHELCGLNREELAANKKNIAAVLGLI